MATCGGSNWMRTYQNWSLFQQGTGLPDVSPAIWNPEAGFTMRTHPSNGGRTVVEVLERAVEQHGNRRAAGWREVKQVHFVDEGGARREKIELENEYRWITYNEYLERVRCLARGFNLAGVEGGSKVVIYAETQVDWMVSAYAAFQSSCQVVTIYATLGEDGAIHGINQTEAATIVVDAKLLKVVAKILPRCKSLKRVITMAECDAGVVEQVKAHGVNVDTVEDLVKNGKTWTYSPSKPKPDDIAVIMYTSGTTGAPKGVVITHSNIVAVVAGVEHAVDGVVDHTSVYCSYLPLAHIMEMGAEISCMCLGAALGFGSPHTLTDNSVKLKRPESMGDAVVLQPTFMIFAPAVLDKVYQAVESKREQLGGLQATMFRWGLNSGERHFKRGQVGANRLLNALVFKKVQGLLGGRLKAMITGSAPLSADVQRYVQTVLDVPVRQGYGLTETCAGSCVAFWGDNSTCSVGAPTVSAVIRLADWPEGNYLNADEERPDIGMRRGEVLIGGPGVSPGYYLGPSRDPELEKKNKEEFVLIDGVRYFRTGDIGQLRANGTLQIIDRKKDLWKGPNGEYVALTKVEAALTLCEFVELPMCYGRTGGDYPVALICPQKKKILALAQSMGLAGEYESLCKEACIVEKVADACREKCKEKRLVAFEVPRKFALIPEVWTPDNGMLTAALKLKRPCIAEMHKADIDEMYKQ